MPLLENLHEYLLDEEYDPLDDLDWYPDSVLYPPNTSSPTPHQPRTPGSDYWYAKGLNGESPWGPHEYCDPAYEHDQEQNLELGRAERTDRAQHPFASRAYLSSYGTYSYATREGHHTDHQRKLRTSLQPSPPLSPVRPVNSHPPSSSSSVFPHVPSSSALRPPSSPHRVIQLEPRSVYDTDATSSSLAKVESSSAAGHRTWMFERSEYGHADDAEQLSRADAHCFQDYDGKIAVQRDRLDLLSLSFKRGRLTYDREHEHEHKHEHEHDRNRNRLGNRHMIFGPGHNPFQKRRAPAHGPPPSVNSKFSGFTSRDEDAYVPNRDHDPNRKNFALYRTPPTTRRPTDST
jgi:hypothetical protein